MKIIFIIGFILASSLSFASSKKSALGFVGSSYEVLQGKIPQPVIDEAPKAIFYKMSGFNSMLCSGAAIQQNGHTYFLTAAHCIIDRLQKEWTEEWTHSGQQSQNSEKEKMETLLNFLNQRTWTVQMSQGINVENCKEYVLLVEGKSDLESYKFCSSKSFNASIRLKYITSSVLSWFVLGNVNTAALSILPFYDLAVFEIEKNPDVEKLTIMNLAKSEADTSTQYAVGYPANSPHISSSKSGTPLFKPLGKEGLAISWGPKTEKDAPILLHGKDGDIILKSLGLSIESWQKSSNVFLSFIRPGMSGGPVLNARGEIVSLATATPRFKKDMDYNSMLTVGPPLSILNWVLSQLRIASWINVPEET